MDCLRCGGPISDEASACPHCSYIHGIPAALAPGLQPHGDDPSIAAETMGRAHDHVRSAWIFSCLSIFSPVAFIPFALFFSASAMVKSGVRSGIGQLLTMAGICAVWLLMAYKGH